MGYKIEKGNILDYTADAIVIPANPRPIVGNGVDKLIYNAAGKETLLSIRKEIGDIKIGEVALTTAVNLNAKYIIHAVCPAWDGGNNEEEKLLQSCYEKSLQIAYKNDCKSIVFPLLSTGVLKFSKELSQSIASSVINNFLTNYDMDVTLVLYDKDRLLQLEKKIDEYLRENDYSQLDLRLYKELESRLANNPEDMEGRDVLSLMRKQYARMCIDKKLMEDFNYFKKRKSTTSDFMGNGSFRIGYMTTMSSIDDFISNAPPVPRFEEKLEYFKIKHGKRNWNDKTICDKINISYYTWSRMKTKNVRNARDILWSLSIVLELDRNEAEELFRSYGLTTSGYPSDIKFNVERERVILYFIENHNYDLVEVNRILEIKNYELLGDFGE